MDNALEDVDIEADDITADFELDRRDTSPENQYRRSIYSVPVEVTVSLGKQRISVAELSSITDASTHGISRNELSTIASLPDVTMVTSTKDVPMVTNTHIDQNISKSLPNIYEQVDTDVEGLDNSKPLPSENMSTDVYTIKTHVFRR